VGGCIIGSWFIGCCWWGGACCLLVCIIGVTCAWHWYFKGWKILFVEHIFGIFIVVFHRKFRKFVTVFVCVSIVGYAVHQFSSILFCHLITADAVSALGNGVVQVWPAILVFSQVAGEEGFKTFIQPLTGV